MPVNRYFKYKVIRVRADDGAVTRSRHRYVYAAEQRAARDRATGEFRHVDVQTIRDGCLGCVDAICDDCLDSKVLHVR